MSANIREVGCGLSLILMIITLILSIIGTIGPQMYGSYGSEQDETVTEHWYLYKYITTVEERERSWGYKPSNVPCGWIYSMYTAAFAFAILSCFGAAVSVSAAAYTWSKPRCSLQAMLWAIIANFVLLTVAWPVSEAVRTRTLCHKDYSAADAGYKPDFGLSLLVSAWCVNGVAVLFTAIFSGR